MNGVEVFSDYRKMLMSGLADAVIIAVPHYLHPPIAEEAFRCGLHVLTEKPAGVSATDVASMNEAASNSGRVFGIMWNQRTNPLFQKAEGAYEERHAGNTQEACLDYYQLVPDAKLL